jgi:dienelactone hydrolase
MRFLLLIFFNVFVLEIIAQCNGPRYKTFVFDEIAVTNDITYGENINVSNELQSLEMDVYRPASDPEPERALIILAHGGSFIFGNKQDLEAVAIDYARLGYVAVSIEYRLGLTENIFVQLPDSADVTAAVARGVQDMRAAVRWFVKDATEGDNQFNIDVNNIFVGGFSAGGVIVNHALYLDKEEEWPPFGPEHIGLEGGPEGNSGNQGYDYEIKAGINIAGALGDTTWIQPGDEPMASFHGTEDDVVPFGYDIVTIAIPPFNLEVGYIFGSSIVHEQLDNLGILNCFTPYQGQGHVPENSNPLYADTTFIKSRNFLATLICEESLSCNYEELFTSLSSLEKESISIQAFPNPFTASFSLGFNSDLEADIFVFDGTGKQVGQYAGYHSGSLLKWMINPKGFICYVLFLGMVTKPVFAW